MFDDSAPRVPVGDDVLPGQAITLNVGLVAAVNGYGDDLEPGQYTLVFDMVQGDDRWFSYANDAPLQIPVTVITDTPGAPAAGDVSWHRHHDRRPGGRDLQRRRVCPQRRQRPLVQRAPRV